jgi:hypothetical protein
MYSEQLLGRPTEPLGYVPPLIQEIARIVDESLPSLERHLRRCMG